MTGVVASTSTKSPASTKSTKSPSKSLLGSFFQLFSFSSKKTPTNKDTIVPKIVTTNKCEADDDHTQDSASSSSDEENDKSQGDKSITPPKPSTSCPSSTDVPQPIAAFSPVKDSKEQQQATSSSKSLPTSNHRDKTSSSPRLNTLTNDSMERPNSVTRDTHRSGSSSSSKRSFPRAVNGSSTCRSNHGTRGEESKERENENNSSIRPSRSFNSLGEAHARHAASNKQRQYKPCSGEDEILAESTLYPSYGSSKRLSPPSVYSSANSDAGGSSSSHRSRSRSSSRSHIDDEGSNKGNNNSGGRRSRSGSRSHHHSNSNSNHGRFDGMIGNFQIFPSENNRRSHNSSTGSSKGSNHGNNREEQGSYSARSSSRSHHHHESSGSLSAASSRSRSNSHSLSPRLIPNNAPIRVPSIGSSLHTLAAQAESQAHPLSPQQQS